MGIGNRIHSREKKRRLGWSCDLNVPIVYRWYRYLLQTHGILHVIWILLQLCTHVYVLCDEWIGSYGSLEIVNHWAAILQQYNMEGGTCVVLCKNDLIMIINFNNHNLYHMQTTTPQQLSHKSWSIALCVCRYNFPIVLAMEASTGLAASIPKIYVSSKL